MGGDGAVGGLSRAGGRPLWHKTKEACDLQCDRESRRVWAYDLPPKASGGAPKRYVAADVREFEAGRDMGAERLKHVREA